MADLELAETSETAPSLLITPPRPGLFPLAGLRPDFLVSPFRRPRSFVVAVAYSSKPIVHLCEDPILPDAHTASLCASRDRLAEALGGSGFHDGELLAEAHSASLRPLADRLAKALGGNSKVVVIVHEKILPTPKEASYPRSYGARKAHQPVKGLGASLCDPFLPDAHSASPLAVAASLGGRRMLSNQGGSSGSGSGGRAGGERSGGEGDGNRGGGQREGIGNERRGNRGRNHGGGNGNGYGDDDGNDRRGLLGYIGGERGPMGPGPYGLAEILPFLNIQMIGTLASLDIHSLPARAMIYRVVSLGFNSVALVCLPASIGQRRTSPRLASMLCLIASSATLLGFVSMIAMAISASFIP